MRTSSLFPLGPLLYLTSPPFAAATPASTDDPDADRAGVPDLGETDITTIHPSVDDR